MEHNKAEYEKQPLAVKRQGCRVDVKRATVQHMMAEYEMKEFTKMIKQREKNFSLQIKAAIVDFSKTMLQRWKEDKYLENLESIGAELKEKLNGYTLQVYDGGTLLFFPLKKFAKFSCTKNGCMFSSFLSL